LVPLGEVVSWRNEFLLIDDTQTYRRPRVQLHAQGIVLRDEVPGALIKTKRQQVCHTNDLLVAEIDAKMGGYGIVPNSLDGAIVSSHYFLFEIDHRRLLPRFLDFFIRTPMFADQIRARGSTNYSAIRASHVLGYTMPLPPLDVQRRIVARLDAVEARLTARRRAAEAVEAELAQALAAAFRRITANAPRARMGEVAPLVRRAVSIDPEATYTEIGVRSFFRGTFHRRTLSGADFTWQKLFRIKEGDLIFSNLMAWEQGIALASAEDDGCVGNHRMLTCEADRTRVVPAVLWFYFTTEEGFARVLAASPGTIARNKTLSAEELPRIEVPLPSLDAQLWFDRLQQKARAAREAAAAAASELHHLLPALLAEAFGA
jgi:type I restriction enzyme S subunit